MRFAIMCDVKMKNKTEETEGAFSLSLSYRKASRESQEKYNGETHQ